ncbi:MAG: MXAN_5187 C-terminal domain-containing protein [Myxococcota bacterium]
MNVRSRLLTAVVVTCVAAAVAGFLLAMKESPEAGRARLLIDVMVMAALAATVFVVTRPPLQRREELIDAMRALARGAKERRLDHERFGELSDIARTYNELAAALTERNDPNLGPVKAKRRERPPWQGQNYSDHPELGEVRVMSRRASEPIVREFDAEAKLRGPGNVPVPAPRKSEDVPVRATSTASDETAGNAVAQEAPSSPEVEQDPEAKAEGTVDAADVDAADVDAGSGRPIKAAPDNDTAIDALLEAPAEADEEEPSGDPADAQGSDVTPAFDMRTLFDEFMEAKRELGEDVPELDFASFASALDDEIERLRRDHQCRSVRFEVCVQNDEVSLQPRLLR